MEIIFRQTLDSTLPFCHLEIAWQCYCLCVWCTLLQGTTRDYNDHVRRMQKVLLSVGLARSAKLFPVWTITSIITLFFSRVASPLDHRCWLISRTGSQYEAVVSVEVFAVVCGTRVSPPGDQIRWTAQIDCQHGPHTLGVDIQPRKRRPGKVSRIVSPSPLVLDMTLLLGMYCLWPPWSVQWMLSVRARRWLYLRLQW